MRLGTVMGRFPGPPEAGVTREAEGNELWHRHRRGVASPAGTGCSGAISAEGKDTPVLLGERERAEHCRRRRCRPMR